MTAILFVGDVVGSARPARAARAAARAARRVRPGLRRGQRRERRRRGRHHAEAGRRAASTPAPTSSRSATTPTATARSGRTSTSSERIIRPANFLRSQPGRGTRGGRARRDVRSASSTCPATSSCAPATRPSPRSTRRCARSPSADHVLVDMHAEATSEKVALGWYLDGRVTAVVGTHTHVPTADARVLPGGTAYITDVGMTGARAAASSACAREQSIARSMRHAHAACATTDPGATRRSARAQAVLIEHGDGWRRDCDPELLASPAAGRTLPRRRRCAVSRERLATAMSSGPAPRDDARRRHVRRHCRASAGASGVATAHQRRRLRDRSLAACDWLRTQGSSVGPHPP